VPFAAVQPQRICGLAIFGPFSHYTIISRWRRSLPQNNVPVTLGSSQPLPVGRNAITYVARDANGNVVRTTTFVTVESGTYKQIYGKAVHLLLTVEKGRNPPPPMSHDCICLIRCPT
jgi:hypothetical protein